MAVTILISFVVVCSELFVYQVDEISDIGSPLRERYQEHTASLSRCLKLSLTDGVQRVIGIEYRPIPMLRCLSPAGLKVCEYLLNKYKESFATATFSICLIGSYEQVHVSR